MSIARHDTNSIESSPPVPELSILVGYSTSHQLTPPELVEDRSEGVPSLLNSGPPFSYFRFVLSNVRYRLSEH